MTLLFSDRRAPCILQMIPADHGTPQGINMIPNKGNQCPPHRRCPDRGTPQTATWTSSPSLALYFIYFNAILKHTMRFQGPYSRESGCRCGSCSEISLSSCLSNPAEKSCDQMIFDQSDFETIICKIRKALPAVCAHNVCWYLR